VEGTRNLAEAAAEAGVSRFLFVSHVGAHPTSAYPSFRSKALAEEEIRRSGVPHTILRSSVIYGPEDHFTTSLAMMMAMMPVLFLLPGDGETLLQPLHVEDLATALTWSLEDPATLNQTYGIGGPEFLTFAQALELIMRFSGTHRIAIPSRPPFLRIGANLMEWILPDPPLTSGWLDYLAVHRTAELQTLPRVFGLQPARMEAALDYLGEHNWLRAFFTRQRLAGRRNNK
jgi:NADH dehydrogenase